MKKIIIFLSLLVLSLYGIGQRRNKIDELKYKLKNSTDTATYTMHTETIDNVDGSITVFVYKEPENQRTHTMENTLRTELHYPKGTFDDYIKNDVRKLYPKLAIK